jgi:hypothetical protein
LPQDPRPTSPPRPRRPLPGLSPLLVWRSFRTHSQKQVSFLHEISASLRRSSAHGGVGGSMRPSPKTLAIPPASAADAPRHQCRHDVAPGQGARGADVLPGGGARPSAGVRALWSSHPASSRSSPWFSWHGHVPDGRERTAPRHHAKVDPPGGSSWVRVQAGWYLEGRPWSGRPDAPLESLP